LFEETPKVRKRLLKYLAQALNEEEYLYLAEHLYSSITSVKHQKIMALLHYAPEPLLKKIETSLEDIRKITQNI